jgi:hypothetical protein
VLPAVNLLFEGWEADNIRTYAECGMAGRDDEAPLGYTAQQVSGSMRSMAPGAAAACTAASSCECCSYRSCFQGRT